MAQCVDYATSNGNEEPPWGLDGSASEFKHDILCCTKSSLISSIVTTPGNLKEDDMKTPGPGEEPQSPQAQKGAWFHTSNGWNAGSHDDAVHFCKLKKINGVQYELCSYESYCPSGPSHPSAEGLADFDDSSDISDQYAPVSGDNKWVMIGMHGTNKASQCLTYGQLHNGKDPMQDELNPEQKQYIRCCEPA